MDSKQLAVDSRQDPVIVTGTFTLVNCTLELPGTNFKKYIEHGVMRQSGKGKASKDEFARDIERTLIEISDFDSVRCREKWGSGGLEWIDITVERQGKTTSLRVKKIRLSNWKVKCEEEGKFTSIAYPIRDRMNEKLEEE